MPSFNQRRQTLKNAYAGERAIRDVLKLACREGGADYRTVHVPPATVRAGAAVDTDTVRRWPTEAYAGRPYQLRCDDANSKKLACPPGILETWTQAAA